MEFWGVEVKSGKPLEVNLDEDKVLHLSQACLGESKNKSNESVYLHIKVDDKNLVLGTLNSERLPQQLFDLVFDRNFQLSHNWKNGSVYFYGYLADQPPMDDDYSDLEEDDEEKDVIGLTAPFGKQEDKKEDKPVVANKKDGKQKVKIMEPEIAKEADEDDSDSNEDDSISEGSESDEDDDDSGDSDEEEETPKKQQSGKKRPNESAMKTPVNEKKAKMSTPQKTDGKKAGGHVATPHPSKQIKKSNQDSPASGSAHSCKSCNRNFKSDVALQSHNQAKHK